MFPLAKRSDSLSPSSSRASSFVLSTLSIVESLVTHTSAPLSISRFSSSFNATSSFLSSPLSIDLGTSTRTNFQLIDPSQDGRVDDREEFKQDKTSSLPSALIVSSNTHSTMTRSKAYIFKTKVYVTVINENIPPDVHIALQSPKWTVGVMVEYQAVVDNVTWSLICQFRT